MKKTFLLISLILLITLFIGCGGVSEDSKFSGIKFDNSNDQIVEEEKEGSEIESDYSEPEEVEQMPSDEQEEEYRDLNENIISGHLDEAAIDHIITAPPEPGPSPVTPSDLFAKFQISVSSAPEIEICKIFISIATTSVRVEELEVECYDVNEESGEFNVPFSLGQEMVLVFHVKKQRTAVPLAIHMDKAATYSFEMIREGKFSVDTISVTEEQKLGTFLLAEESLIDMEVATEGEILDPPMAVTIYEESIGGPVVGTRQTP